MAFALVSGALHRAPEFRTSKAGAPFAKLSQREQDGITTRWWSILTFSASSLAELKGVAVGDAISARGRLEVEIYTPSGGGEPRVSLSLIADSILPLKRPPAKPRAPRERSSSRGAPASSSAPGGGTPFDDPVDFGYLEPRS